MIVVRVRDTGIGIAPDVLPRIFDLFVQETQAIDRAQGGLGLGLAIVRNLVERHGGSVAATSDGPGCGSEFIVRLPRAASVAGRDPASATAAGGPGPMTTGVRLLIVDDNADAAIVLADAFSSRGYPTRIAHDGPEALVAAAEFRPDIAILDIGLPVMDGYELAARLRELPGAGGMRLIAVTGYGQPSDREKTLAAGFDHHFVKPVDFNAIETAVNAPLARRDSTTPT